MIEQVLSQKVVGYIYLKFGHITVIESLVRWEDNSTSIIYQRSKYCGGMYWDMGYTDYCPKLDYGVNNGTND